MFVILFFFFNLDKRFIIVHTPARGTVKYYLRIFTKCLEFIVMQQMCMSMKALLVEQRINESVCQFLVAFVMTEDVSGAVQNRKTVLFKTKYTTFHAPK